jgi:methionine synthase I (cobalamin-dependent)
MMGVRPADAAKMCSELAPALIGANCGTSLQNMEAVLREYAATVPGYGLWAKPNAGIPHLEGGIAVYDVSPHAMAEFAREAIRVGARVVGGCCGSTPDHVRAMAQAVKLKAG